MPTAKALSSAGIWLIPQPKFASVTGDSFDLAKCKGIRLLRCSDAGLPALLKDRCGVRLTASRGGPLPDYISLVLCADGTPPKGSTLAASDMKDLGEQGYYLRIDKAGVTIGAATETGLYYGTRTLAQIAADRAVLPGVTIRDWPALRYRGFQYDVSRGQMPKLDTLKRLTGVCAEAKLNMLELYIEHLFKWERYPDIAPPEAMTPKDARELFDFASRYHMEVHPMMQTFGHFHNIGTKPNYRKFMTPDGGTVDIRKPEAVAFVLDLIDEVCEAFPGKFLNVDITEINDEAFKQSGTTQEQLTELTLQYALKIREAAAKHDMRLIVVQGPLAAEGTLAGLGSVVGRLPKDVAVGSYYTAEFYGGWDKDFPRLRGLGLDFFAQPWIDSHGHIMPYVGHSMDFSDITVSRGLQHGAIGSVTCDWGDDGHYHLPSTTWYPALYHGASAWAGGSVDRAYFDKAFCKLVFGTTDDSIARAINLAGNINGQSIKLRMPDGTIQEPPYNGNSRFGRYYYEFFGDPFTDPRILDIVEPGPKGREILDPALEAVALLERAQREVPRNKDIVEQLLFTARHYVALGNKLIAREHYLDESIARDQVAGELISLAASYEVLKADFRRLWLKDCKNAGTFAGYLQRFDGTINACRAKARELREGP